MQRRKVKIFKKILRTAEMRALRAIRRISLRDKMKSEQIRYVCDIQDRRGLEQGGNAEETKWKE